MKPEHLKLKSAWAVCDNRGYPIPKTVADTRRAAVVNWLATDGGMFISNNHTDAAIEHLWLIRGSRDHVTVERVAITAGHQDLDAVIEKAADAG